MCLSGHHLFRVHQRYRRFRAVRPCATHQFVGGAAVKRLRDRLLHLSRIALAIGCAVASTGTVQAAEIKLMSSGGMRVALIALTPAFERVTKHKIAATYGAPGTIRDRVLAGELMDVLVFPDAGLDALAKQGKIVSGSKVILARSGMGVAVRRRSQARYQHARRIQARPACCQVDRLHQPRIGLTKRRALCQGAGAFGDCRKDGGQVKAARRDVQKTHDLTCKSNSPMNRAWNYYVARAGFRGM